MGIAGRLPGVEGNDAVVVWLAGLRFVFEGGLTG